MLEMFFGILILSFVVERFFEIISSLIEYAFCHKGEKKWGLYTDIDEEKVKQFEPIKKLIFTPLGIAIGYYLVTVTGISILYKTGLLTQVSNLDQILTAVAISWGTGPIHSLIGGIQKYKESK